MRKRWIVGAFIVALVASFGTAGPAAPSADRIVVDAGPAGVVNVFNPQRAIGAGVDSQTTGAVETIYAPRDVQAMLATGLGPVTYRLYAELSVQQWHWNQAGSWSDPHAQGYWTGSAKLGTPVEDSFGYRLPHRGFTFDQGNNDDYSRLDDGDPATYWKSDPYLTHGFTGDSDDAHPQWALVDLGAKNAVDAIQLIWTAPYATAYRVQYWTGSNALYNPAQGTWADFPQGRISSGRGGTVTLRLAAHPLAVRYVRVLMTHSSNTCDTHGSSDPRNCAGFALAELGVGTLTRGGAFTDLVRHQPSNRQTPTYVSSVDPWHTPGNRVRDQEQPGLDVFYRSGVTRGKPAMLPVGMLYGTPDDAAAEMRYVESRGYPISYVELGEEPDGQYVSPEDDAALYVQWAHALHAVDPQLKLGGPVFQGVTSDVQYWADSSGNVSWLQRFLAYLTAHNARSEMSFMSFEHYPFNGCSSAQPNLLAEAGLIRSVTSTWHHDGIPANVPLFITETNYSADFAAAPQQIIGALWFADAVGAFFAAGGKGFYLYEYEPTPLFRSSNCNSFGALNPWNADAGYHVRQPAAEFFAANILMQSWALPVDANHVQHAAYGNFGAGGTTYVTPYALHRPDGSWSVMIVNNDLAGAHDSTVDFARSGGPAAHFTGRVTMTTLSPAQYVWHANGPNGFAKPDGPAEVTTLTGAAGTRYHFPAASITVLSGAIR